MRNEIVETNRIGTIILGIFLLTIMGYSAWFFIELVYHMQIPLWYKVFFILGVTFTAFVLTEGISPKNKWNIVLPVLLITCLIVFFIPPGVGFSETAEVNVVSMGVRVSDELKVDYTIPIDNKTHSTSKTYESKPGWKFIILELGVVNNVVDLLSESFDLFPNSILMGPFAPFLALQLRQYLDLFTDLFTFFHEKGKQLPVILERAAQSTISAKVALDIGQFSSEWIRVN